MIPLTQRWQRLTRRGQILVASAAGALGLWLVYLAALHPLYRWLNRLHRDVRQAEEQLIEAVIASRHAEAVEEDFAAYARYVKPLQAPEQELAGFLSEVESAVGQSGMAVLNLKPVTPNADATDRLSVAVEGESTPEQLVTFLDLIQRSPRLLRVTELAVRVSESQTLRSSLVISKLLLKAS